MPCVTKISVWRCRSHSFSDLARPKVKAFDFHGKEAHLKFREREHQSATLCTLTMTNNIDSTGVARYPVGTCPVMDPATGATLIDELGRRLRYALAVTAAHLVEHVIPRLQVRQWVLSLTIPMIKASACTRPCAARPTSASGWNNKRVLATT